MTPEQIEAIHRFQEQILANFNLAGAILVIFGAALCYLGPGLHDWRFLKRRLRMQDDARVSWVNDGLVPDTSAWDEAELHLRVEILEAKEDATPGETRAERYGLAFLVFGALAVLLAAIFQWNRTFA